jgi:hypothetical protein
MALIVEDGSGLADAESYCSVAVADSYHLKRGRETAWVDDLETEEKEFALRKATDYMLQEYRDRWDGFRVDDVQTLDWPRYEVIRKDAMRYGHEAYYPHDTVPREVQNACAELAFKSLTVDLGADLGPQVVSQTVGPISQTLAPGARQRPKFKAVDDMLMPFLDGSGIGVKVYRA